MKRLLIVRYPKTFTPENGEFLANKIRSVLSELFIVLFVSDNVEKTEFEIVYDPHFNEEKLSQPDHTQFEGSLNPDAEKRVSQGIAREFLHGNQVDTPTNAYMEGKP